MKDSWNLLKAFVRTQFYRPLFFKPDNFLNFTTDESAYWCKTKKFYVNHEGKTMELKFMDGNIDTVDKVESGL